MDLLETVLRAAGAVQHLEAFKKEHIDSHTLKILNDEDLEILGVQNEEMRKSILKQFKNLQIPSELRVDITFNHSYIKEVLGNIAYQISIYNAKLTPLTVRSDIRNYDIPLSKACDVVSTAVDELHDEVHNLKSQLLEKTGKVQNNVKKPKMLKGFLISLLMVTNLFALRYFAKYLMKK